MCGRVMNAERFRDSFGTSQSRVYRVHCFLWLGTLLALLAPLVPLICAMAAPPNTLGHLCQVVRMAGRQHTDWLIAFPDASPIVKSLGTLFKFTELLPMHPHERLPPPPIGNRWVTMPNGLALRMFGKVFRISSGVTDSRVWARTNLFECLPVDTLWDQALDALCFAGLFQSTFHDLHTFEEAMLLFLPNVSFPRKKRLFQESHFQWFFECICFRAAQKLSRW